jgi:hypothetical protein
MSPGFNVDAAHQAGVTDDQIYDHLTQLHNYDGDKAIQAGATKQQVINYLAARPTPGSPQFGVQQQGPQTFTKGTSLPPDMPEKMLHYGAEALPAIGATAATLLAPEAAIPAIGAALLGGGIGSTAKQGIEYAAGDPNAPKSWGQAAKNVGWDAALEAGTEGAGRLLGATAGAVGRKLSPRKLYQGALKPLPSMAEPDRARAIESAFEHRIPLNDKAPEAAKSVIDDYQRNVANAIASNPNTAPIDPQQMAQSLNALRARWKYSPDYQKAIDDFEQMFLTNNPNPLSAAEAQDMKKEFYRRVIQENKNAYRQGVTPGIDTEARQYIANSLKGELEARYPELKGLNAGEGAAIELNKAIERFVGREGNKNVVGLIPAIIGTGALAGGAGEAYAGRKKEGAGVATAGALLALALNNPNIASRLAIALSQAQKSGAGRALKAVTAPKAINVANALRLAEQAVTPPAKPAQAFVKEGQTRYLNNRPIKITKVYDDNSVDYTPIQP